MFTQETNKGKVPKETYQYVLDEKIRASLIFPGELDEIFANYLYPDEKIIASVSTWGEVDDVIINVNLFLTNHRLFRSTSDLGKQLSIGTISLGEISTVEFVDDALFFSNKKLTVKSKEGSRFIHGVSTTDNSLFKKTNAVAFERFAALLSEQIGTYKKEQQAKTNTEQAKPTAGSNDVVSQLERLASLLEKGLLTAEEFQTQKKALLAG